MSFLAHVLGSNIRNLTSLMHRYKTERPVNSATISPIRDHVILGGGEDAMAVTQTKGKVGKFHAQFWHMVRFPLVNCIVVLKERVNRET